MTPEKEPGEVQIEAYIPLDFLGETAPDFADSGLEEIRGWFDQLVEEGIITEEIRDERIEQIEESRGVTTEDKA